MVPSNIFISPSIADSREDLPAPTFPTIAISLPASRFRLMLQDVEVDVHVIFKTIRQEYLLEKTTDDF